MNVLDPRIPFLNGSQMVEAASAIDVVHTRTLKTIERLQKDVDARKRIAADRWKGTSHLMTEVDRRRIEHNEVHAAIVEIQQAAEKELDAILKEAGALHQKAISQREFYDSPVKTLNRVTLGDPKRSEYMRQVAAAGKAELTHLAQYAVSTGNDALAAAIVARLDGVAVKDREFSQVELAQAMNLEEHRKGAESLKIVDARLQSILVAIRTWKAGKSNPLNTVQLALRNQELDASILDELEADDGRDG